MGLFDYIILEDEIKLPEFPDKYDESDIKWQTKDIGQPFMRKFKITNDGKLLRRESSQREMSDEEANEKAQERGYESWNEWEQDDDSIGPLDAWKTVTDEIWWVNHNMHGSFEFHTSIREDDSREYYSYEARFTEGELEDIVFLNLK